MRTIPGFHRAKKKAAVAGHLLFSVPAWLLVSRDLLRGERAEDDAGDNADQNIVVADANPFLAAAGWLMLMFGHELVTGYLGLFTH